MTQILVQLGDLELYAVRNKGTGKYLTDDEARGCYEVEHVTIKELLVGVSRTQNFRGIFETYEDAQSFLDGHLDVNDMEDEREFWDVVYVRPEVLRD